MPGLAKETPPPRQAALESTLTRVCERTDPAQRPLPYPRGWDEDSLTGTRSSGSADIDRRSRLTKGVVYGAPSGKRPFHGKAR